MKPSKIIFVNKELEQAFNNLPDKDPIKKALIRVLKNIKEDFQSGRNVKKDLIPKEYVQNYHVDNLRIYNLPSAWRLIYTITGSNEIGIIAVVLDWMTHKDYERLFKF